jgi:ubiquinol-cytochrome c reductase cytochrome b subunit
MYKKPHYPDGMRFYPTFVFTDVAVIFAFLALMFAVVFFFPEWLAGPDAQIPADPFNTPEHIKPEWYFLAAYQLLKLMPKIPALVLQTLAIVAFICLPFLHRSPTTQNRPVFFISILCVVLAFIALTYWGAVS